MQLVGYLNKHAAKYTLWKGMHACSINMMQYSNHQYNLKTHHQLLYLHITFNFNKTTNEVISKVGCGIA